MFRPKVLLLSRDKEETRKWREILREQVFLTEIRDRVELRDALKNCEYDALLCSWSFPKEAWTDALRAVEESCPDMPMIVFSGTQPAPDYFFRNQVIETEDIDLLVAS